MDNELLGLGATLYVPASRTDLLAIANGLRFPTLRSVIFCLEDSLHAHEVEGAISNLETTLPLFSSTPLRRFIRVRTPEHLPRLLACEGIRNVEGFVIPKATRENLSQYFDYLSSAPEFRVMPVMESKETFDARSMQRLRSWLDKHPLRGSILGIRIGGNDLLNLLGLRRRPRQSIYDTPVATAIENLINVFRPAGYSLAAPVFDGLRHHDVLAKEVRRDIDRGLLSKTAVHPDQLSIIESEYAVTPQDLEAAKSLLAADAPAVFRLHGMMCERATHSNWARLILAREAHFGVRGSRVSRVTLPIQEFKLTKSI